MAKPLRYTQHALDVMAERLLSSEWVEATVRNPQWVELDTRDAQVERRFRAIAERDGRILRVACVETTTDIRVISTFLDRRARPR
jgi:uncharacterized DUF497 family protein